MIEFLQLLPDLGVTIVGVLIAVGVFSALWVGANLIFSQATRRYPVFSAVIGALAGAIVLAILDGNRLLQGVVERPANLFNGEAEGLFTDGLWPALGGHFFWPLIGALIGGAVGWALATVQDRTLRLAASMGALGGAGLILSFALKSRYELAMRTQPLLVWTIAFVVIGVGLAVLRGRDPIKSTLPWAAVGWMLGSFGGALQGVGSSNQLETSTAFVITGLLLGAWLGLTGIPDVTGRAQIDDRGRAWLFVGPAVAFIAVMLIIPALLTLRLSLQTDEDNDASFGFANYSEVFSNDDNVSTERLNVLFTSEVSDSIFPWGGSELLPWALFFAVAGGVLALLLGRETGQRFNVGGAPMGPLLLAAGFFAFALFTHLRGTIINNLWWVVAVTLFSTSLGLAVAKLSDGARFEAVAKSFVFMPMAISFVGASIIWRLIMYQARNVTKDQTGVFNAIWIWLGEQTTTWGAGKVIIGGIFAAAALALVFAAVRGLRASPSASGLYVVMAVIPAWVALRTFGDGIGGYTITDAGEIRPEAVNFVQGVPFNNFWLMVILIWAQTGFAMVILSAAIKAVPEDFIEAAKIDGATDGQIFWRITVPSIAPTIGVVATTIMVNVMKVFDIVKVTTNGQFDSQVLANAMWSEAFLFFNQGVGATLAVLIFVGIFPVMVFNIYNLTKGEG
jgi:alpha-glucoside transport system permease protein